MELSSMLLFIVFMASAVVGLRAADVAPATSGNPTWHSSRPDHGAALPWGYDMRIPPAWGYGVLRRGSAAAAASSVPLFLRTEATRVRGGGSNSGGSSGSSDTTDTSRTVHVPATSRKSAAEAKSTDPGAEIVDSSKRVRGRRAFGVISGGAAAAWRTIRRRHGGRNTSTGDGNGAPSDEPQPHPSHEEASSDQTGDSLPSSTSGGQYATAAGAEQVKAGPEESKHSIAPESEGGGSEISTGATLPDPDSRGPPGETSPSQGSGGSKPSLPSSKRVRDRKSKRRDSPRESSPSISYERPRRIRVDVYPRKGGDTSGEGPRSWRGGAPMDRHQREIEVRDTLKKAESLLGPSHPRVASMMFLLSRILQERGAYEEAESLCSSALQIYEDTLGPEHPDVSVTLNCLALSWQAQVRDERRGTRDKERETRDVNVERLDTRKMAQKNRGIGALWLALSDCRRIGQ